VRLDIIRDQEQKKKNIEKEKSALNCKSEKQKCKCGGDAIRLFPRDGVVE